MRIGTFAAALASAGLLAIPAHAQTEIQWWHSMGGALGEKLNALADEVQREPEGLQGRARPSRAPIPSR